MIEDGRKIQQKQIDKQSSSKRLMSSERQGRYFKEANQEQNYERKYNLGRNKRDDFSGAKSIDEKQLIYRGRTQEEKQETAQKYLQQKAPIAISIKSQTIERIYEAYNMAEGDKITKKAFGGTFESVIKFFQIFIAKATYDFQLNENYCLIVQKLLRKHLGARECHPYQREILRIYK